MSGFGIEGICRAEIGNGVGYSHRCSKRLKGTVFRLQSLTSNWVVIQVWTNNLFRPTCEQGRKIFIHLSGITGVYDCLRQVVPTQYIIQVFMRNQNCALSTNAPYFLGSQGLSRNRFNSAHGAKALFINLLTEATA